MKDYDANNHPAKEAIARIRMNMRIKRIDWLIVFYSDAHLGEYISKCDDYFEEFSGFTGDSATLLFSEDACFLWTDGRYFIQAEHEIKGSGIKLMKMGFGDTPSVWEFLKNNVIDGQTIGFDFKSTPYHFFKELRRGVRDSVHIVDAPDICKESSAVNRKRIFNEITCVSEKNAGKSCTEKIEEIRKEIRKCYIADENKSFAYIVSDICSNMWIFNLRGSDIPYVRAAYSYSIITDSSIVLYASFCDFSDMAVKSLKSAGIGIKDYSRFYNDLKEIVTDFVLVDNYETNACICNFIPHTADRIFVNNHKLIKKYIKNEIEIEGMKNAGIKDGVTVCKFIMKLKELSQKGELKDEFETGKMLDDMRISSGAFSLSFPTICAYGPNAAIVHYEADDKNSLKLASSGLLLVDSGAHYKDEGTTDITRTIALGPVTDEEKRAYTAVLKGNLRLMSLIFTPGLVGQNIDIIARQPIWDIGYDYSHGTGHGVGCDLEVHEAPVRISSAIGAVRTNNYPLVCGMITSDEPGIYVENKFGVRLENMILCVDKSDEKGKRLGFEPLSFVPFDFDAIDFDMLDEKERDTLNQYHKLVYNVISPLLDEVAQSWLKEATKTI